MGWQQEVQILDPMLPMMVLWVDNIMAYREPYDGKYLLELDLESAFKCKIKGELNEYVGSNMMS